MSSSGTPTPHLGLNQWLPNDKPERADFNSDNQKIEAAMGNKVNKSIQSLTGIDVENYSWETGYFSTTTSVTGLPFSSAWRIHCFKDGYDIVLLAFPTAANKDPYIKYYANGQWRAWKQLATAAPPTLYSLPITSGLTATGGYYKNQFGEITIQVQINNSSGFKNGDVIANLPAGYRPKSGFNHTATYHGDNTYSPGAVSISTDGVISVKVNSSPVVSNMYLNLKFLTNES